MTVEQGDIIKLEKMREKFLVVSKNFFNATEQAILCPILQDTFLDPLHIQIQANEVQGIVMCEQMRLVDLRYRGYTKVDRLAYANVIDITDTIQSIFDY